MINHIGVYGIVLKENKILLIDKVGGPYNGKLDLPGGTIKLGEKPEDTLIRELKEETNIDVTKYELYDVISTKISWIHKNVKEEINHIGIIYKVLEYDNKILNNIQINDANDDSKGSNFYNIDNINNLSSLAQT